jgi:hypothetical protein
MKPFRLSRRAVLRGAGSVAIALPWLEIMQPLKSSRAADAPAKRFVAVYTPGGTVLDDWTPSSIVQLSPILSPLTGMIPNLVVLNGLNMQCAVGGEQLQAGMVGLLTGCAQMRNGRPVPNASLDQVLAQKLGSSVLYQAVRWATGSGAGEASDNNILSYGVADGAFTRSVPAIDPAATWQRLFGAVPEAANGAWQKSILDSVIGRYAKLSQKLGSADKRRLETHMEMLRSLERSIKEHCLPPVLVDTPDYDPRAGGGQDVVTDAAIPKVGKLMMDMLVMALSCDLTQVGVMQWADSRAAYTLPWLDLPGGEAQSYYENGGGFDRASMTKIFTWYSTQHAYLLEQMAKVDLGGRTLLDESVVFFGSQQQSPATHAKDHMPFLLAGGGGGLRGGRMSSFEGSSHNDLLSSLANLFGDTRTTFGDVEFCSAPLSGLT